ncbi:hypothetical protein OsI_10872 [Oryza sativa Indica Group]|nr:hypothetical protein OsI_10872 [Oryza sativa Indica Group]
MVQAKHHDEPENHYDETSSDPKTAATHEHSRSTSEDHIFTNTSEPTRTETSEPTRTETSEPTRNGQEVHYVGEVIHPFDAQADGELSISVGDYVVVRQVAPNGWSEGECKGKAGWFPSAYVEQRDKAPASKVIEPGLLTT